MPTSSTRNNISQQTAHLNNFNRLVDIPQKINNGWQIVDQDDPNSLILSHSIDSAGLKVYRVGDHDLPEYATIKYYHSDACSDNNENSNSNNKDIKKILPSQPIKIKDLKNSNLLDELVKIGNETNQMPKISFIPTTDPRLTRGNTLLIKGHDQFHKGLRERHIYKNDVNSNENEFGTSKKHVKTDPKFQKIVTPNEIYFHNYLYKRKKYGKHRCCSKWYHVYFWGFLIGSIFCSAIFCAIYFNTQPWYQTIECSQFEQPCSQSDIVSTAKVDIDERNFRFDCGIESVVEIGGSSVNFNSISCERV